MKCVYIVLSVLYVVAVLGDDPIALEPTPEPTDAITTTPKPTTPEPAPTTTPKPAPTTTPKPAPTTTPKPATTTVPSTNVDYYTVQNGDVTCIMVKGHFQFTITYQISDKVTNKTTITVPKPTEKDKDIKTDGNCKAEEGTQFISISWGSEIPKNNIRLEFNSTDGKNWEVIQFSSIISLDRVHFPNATHAGDALRSEISLEMSPKEAPVNKSYMCYSDVAAVNVTTTLDNVTYTYPVQFNMNAVQIEAFNQIPGTTQFAQATYCQLDKVADIVPIAVGCALAALVIFVAIAYIIGRRRRNAAYQSV